MPFSIRCNAAWNKRHDRSLGVASSLLWTARVSCSSYYIPVAASRGSSLLVCAIKTSHIQSDGAITAKVVHWFINCQSTWMVVSQPSFKWAKLINFHKMTNFPALDVLVPFLWIILWNVGVFPIGWRKDTRALNTPSPMPQYWSRSFPCSWCLK